MKALSVAPLAAGAVLVCGVLWLFDAPAASPGQIPPGAPRTLDLTVVPMTINEPGTYLLRRSWDLRNPNVPRGTTAITVMANDVVIDLQGYQIKFPDYTVGVKIKGNDVTLRDGAMDSSVFSAAIRSSGRRTVVDNLSITTYEGVQLLGLYAEVRDSDMFGRGDTLIVGDNAVIERNSIQSEMGAVILGSNGRLERNRLQVIGDDVLLVRGDFNVVSDNMLDSFSPPGGPGFSYGIKVTGNSNALLRNTVALMQLGAAITVDGTANTLDANVALPTADVPPHYGIRFTQAGNFYGNNRMSAQTPYDLGGLPQTDWGDNVGY